MSAAVKGAAKAGGRHEAMVFVVSVVGLPLLAGGCQDEVKCERERLDLNKAWSELRTAATHHKLEGTDVSTWFRDRDKAELLESSFENAASDLEQRRKSQPGHRLQVARAGVQR